MSKKDKEKETIYYSDPINDDFDSVSDRKARPIKESYKYIHKNIFLRMGSYALTTFIAVPILSLAAHLKDGAKVKNKKVLKEVKHKGYYIYANHTAEFDPIIHISRINPFKRTCVVAGLAAFSIHPFVSLIIRALGAIPTPTSKEMYKSYIECLDYHIKKKHNILMYPEKHIWTYYNDIRPFTSDTFRYPVSQGAPVIVATTIYLTPKKEGKKPKSEIYLDGPFYPDTSLLKVDATNKLRDEVYNAMKKRVNDLQSYEYIHYEYKSKDESSLEN
ncbi:MAG: hypothetical protein LUC16_01695 [Coprobacillus sp.]|nr:hypothetical protein [Coprobacillus sp.]